MFSLRNISNLHGDKTHLLTLGFFLVLFVVIEESLGGLCDLGLVNAPHVLEIVDDFGLFVQRVHNFLSCHVVQSKDTVTDSG